MPVSSVSGFELIRVDAETVLLRVDVDDVAGFAGEARLIATAPSRPRTEIAELRGPRPASGRATLAFRLAAALLRPDASFALLTGAGEVPLGKPAERGLRPSPRRSTDQLEEQLRTAHQVITGLSSRLQESGKQRRRAEQRTGELLAETQDLRASAGAAEERARAAETEADRARRAATDAQQAAERAAAEAEEVRDRLAKAADETRELRRSATALESAVTEERATTATASQRAEEAERLAAERGESLRLAAAELEAALERLAEASRERDEAVADATELDRTRAFAEEQAVQ
ncbi:MAG: hypothetical protein JWM71_851, partial [Solirubrobacteraceae bacterium]|nr:hypothetical protein [Solirubrobacteraceae bacterium]